MSNKITEAFAKGKAFIPFITCGDPSLEVTEQLVYAMEEAGADLIELGIPFSDPGRTENPGGGSGVKRENSNVPQKTSLFFVEKRKNLLHSGGKPDIMTA